MRGVSTPRGQEGEAAEREVRAGSQGRWRAGRVAEPRGDAGLRRSGGRGADHRERRASGVGRLSCLPLLTHRVDPWHVFLVNGLNFGCCRMWD